MDLNANLTIKARQKMELNILFQHQWGKILMVYKSELSPLASAFYTQDIQITFYHYGPREIIYNFIISPYTNVSYYSLATDIFSKLNIDI